MSIKTISGVRGTIGYDGNGGIFYQTSNYKMETLVGNDLPLNHLVKFENETSEPRAINSFNFSAKREIELTSEANLDAVLEKIAMKFRDMDIDTNDGVKIEWIDKWVLLQRSNTQPIIHIYTEASTTKSANELAQQIIDIVKSVVC